MALTRFSSNPLTEGGVDHRVEGKDKDREEDLVSPGELVRVEDGHQIMIDEVTPVGLFTA